MSTMRMTRLSLALAATLAVSCGPVEGAGTGAVEVSWIVGSTTCANAGLAEVELQLYQDGIRILERSAACGDGSLMVPGVAAGTWDLRLLGLTGDGEALYRAEYEGLKVRRGSEPSSPPDPLVLTQIKGALELRWSFPAEMSNCAFAGIEAVEVNINRAATGDLEVNRLYPCNLTLDHPDVNENHFIEIAGLPTDLPLEVVLFGLDEEGGRVLYGDTETTVPKVGSRQVIIPLEPCNGGCI
ncbi:MAG: hypothetical protein FJ098_13705 [Deltaproteobacteria bacterium]|nr:hypothetical protein [Deltaproteobacteria bacterium]